jgi:hypothetical protein
MVGSRFGKDLIFQSFIAIPHAEKAHDQEHQEHKSIDPVGFFAGLVLTPQDSYVFARLGYLKRNHEPQGKCYN